MSTDDPNKPGPNDPQRRQEVRLTPVLDDAVAQGQYSNLATIISGPQEFFIDFGRVVPGKSEFRVFSRVILTPAHAKQLAAALSDHVRRYEQAHGAIPTPPNEPPKGEGGSFH
jgi:hypothetical protein